MYTYMCLHFFSSMIGEHMNIPSAAKKVLSQRLLMVATNFPVPGSSATGIAPASYSRCSCSACASRESSAAASREAPFCSSSRGVRSSALTGCGERTLSPSSFRAIAPSSSYRPYTTDQGGMRRYNNMILYMRELLNPTPEVLSSGTPRLTLPSRARGRCPMRLSAIECAVSQQAHANLKIN